MGKRIVNHLPVITIIVGGIYKPYPVDWVGKKHGSSEAPGCCPETDLAVLASAPSHARQELRGLGEVMEGPGLLMSKKWKVTHQNRVYYICLLCMFTIYVFLNHIYHFTFRHCKNTRPYLQMSLGYQVSPAWALERLPYIRVSCQPSPETRAICQDLARFCWTTADNLNPSKRYWSWRGQQRLAGFIAILNNIMYIIINSNINFVICNVN